jgi:hypothetical protein
VLICRPGAPFGGQVCSPTGITILFEEGCHRPALKTLAEVVSEESNGRLEPQVALRRRPEASMGGRYFNNKFMDILPKFPLRLDNITQVMDTDGQPGVGMLHAVCIEPQQYVPTPKRIREWRSNAQLGFCTLPMLWRGELEQVESIRNVCEPTSVAVMIRTAVAYVRQRDFDGWVATLSLTDAAESAAVTVAKVHLRTAMRPSMDCHICGITRIWTCITISSGGRYDAIQWASSYSARRKLQRAQRARVDADRIAPKAREEVPRRARDFRLGRKDPAVRQRVKPRKDPTPQPKRCIT